MFINPVDSGRLARSVQRDYLKAAEAYRQAKNYGTTDSKSGAKTRIGIVLSGLVALVAMALQFAHV